jgi:hypothetical protein
MLQVFQIVLCAFVSFSLLGCKPISGIARTDATPFLITNAASVAQDVEWMIQYTNGVCVTFGSNNVAITFGFNSSLSATYDSEMKTPTNIILETAAHGAEPGTWVIDLNGDGVPDKRRIKGRQGSQLFYNGDWHWYVPMGHGLAQITNNGAQIVVFFNGHAWQRTDSHVSASDDNQ